jgi:hypothetical protein
MKTDLSRRRFLEPVLGTAILLLIPGCGGGGADCGSTSLADSAAALGATPNGTPSSTPSTTAGTSPGSTPSAGCGSTFDFNHGHVLTILRSDLDSATAVSYDIQGAADHTHTVTFTVAQLAVLKTGASVTVTSSDTFYHQHVITVSCV